MQTVHRFRAMFLITVVVVAFTLIAPGAITAQEESVAGEQLLAEQEQDSLLAPTVPSWDETSGYGSVEASRTAASALFAPVAGPSWDESSGYASVERTRAGASALLSGEL